MRCFDISLFASQYAWAKADLESIDRYVMPLHLLRKQSDDSIGWCVARTATLQVNMPLTIRCHVLQVEDSMGVRWCAHPLLNPYVMPKFVLQVATAYCSMLQNSVPERFDDLMQSSTALCTTHTSCTTSSMVRESW